MFQLQIVFADGRMIMAPIVGIPQGEFTTILTHDGSYVFAPKDCVLVGRMLSQAPAEAEAPPVAEPEPNPVEVAEQIAADGWIPESSQNGVAPAAPKPKRKH